MKRRKLHLLLLAAGTAFTGVASAQLTIDQATFTIQSGATVTVQGDVTSNVDIQGAGKIVLKGAANQNVNVNGFTIPNLEVDNVSNVTLTGPAKISGVLTFTNGDIILGANNLTLTSAATVTGASSSKYIVTNSTGKLIKAALANAAFAYPVGNSTTSYTPVTLTNAGTSDDIGVRAIANVLAGGTTGTAYTKEVVNNTWDITEAVAGGSNLTVTAQWNAANELAGFDRTRTGVSNYITSPAASVGWDLLNNQTTAAAGANPYTVTRAGFTNLGSFAVGTRPVLSALLVSPKVFLQGPFNNGTGRMSDALRTLNLIPLTEPYSSASGSSLITPALRGSGGGETSTASVVGNAAGAATDNTIVDWIIVQLHNASTNAVISQRAALLQRDGDIVDVDGVSPLNMAGNAPSNYFVSVKHRNHIGIRTASSLALAKVTNTNYDFSTSNSQALAPASLFTNTAMTNKFGLPTTTSVFMMWAGNGNTNGNVRYAGPLNDLNVLLNNPPLSGNKLSVSPNGYYLADYNMNGSVRFSGAQNDENILLNVSLLGNKIVVNGQATF